MKKEFGFVPPEKEFGDMLDNLSDNPINPNHYKSKTSLECIDAMRITFGTYHVVNYCLITAYKYLWRHKNKGHAIQDLEKAAWFLNRAYILDGDVFHVTQYQEMNQLIAKFEAELKGDETDGEGN